MKSIFPLICCAALMGTPTLAQDLTKEQIRLQKEVGLFLKKNTENFREEALSTS